MRDLNHDFKNLCRRNRDGSFATQHDRESILTLIANQLELIVPTPAKIAGSTRVALFFDSGNVFSSDGTRFYDKLGDPIDYHFAYDKLKKSVGIGVEWLAPLGLLRFSYAIPLTKDAATDRYFGDQTEGFQFSIGNAF